MIRSSLHFGDAVKLAAAFVLAYIALQTLVILKAVILIFFTALIVAIAMDQFIMRLERKGIARQFAAIVIYVSVAVSLSGALLLVIPPFATELRTVITTYSQYSEELVGEVPQTGVVSYLMSFSQGLSDSPQALVSTALRTASSFTTFLSIFFVAFFLTIQKGGVRSFVIPFLPLAYQERAALFWDKLQMRVGYWLWGKTISSIIVGFITFIGLYLLGVPYALSLGVLAFFFNYVPFVGPIIAAVPAVFLSFNLSFLAVLLTTGWYIIINAIIEPFVLGPIFMRKAIEINPAFLILSVISGAYLGGVLGIIIAIPAAAIIYLAVTEFMAGNIAAAETITTKAKRSRTT